MSGIRPIPQDRRDVPSEAVREWATAILIDAYAEDRIDELEFERRLDAARAVATIGEIDSLVEGLVTPRTETRPVSVAGGAGATYRIAPAGRSRPTQHLFALMSGVSRKGLWPLPRDLTVVALMGGAELDLRDAEIPAEGMTIKAFALMGGVELVLPPGVRVNCEGSAILGGFDSRNLVADVPETGPVIRIVGLALLGGVDVVVRYAGETAADARRRRRIARRESRRRIP